MTAIPGRETGCVLAAVVHAVDWDTAISRIQSWSAARESRYVCITNVHSVVAATTTPSTQEFLPARTWLPRTALRSPGCCAVRDIDIRSASTART